MAVRLPLGGKDGAEHQVVASAVRDGGVDLRERMHRPADEKPPGAGAIARGAGVTRPAAESARRCTPAAPATIAISARSLTRTRVFDPPVNSTIVSHQRGEWPVRQVALADLDDVHAGTRRVHGAHDEVVNRHAVPPAIGDEMARLPRRSGGARRSRFMAPRGSCPASRRPALRQDDGAELDEAGQRRDHADAGHASARVGTVQEGFERRARVGEPIVLPERPTTARRRG